MLIQPFDIFVHLWLITAVPSAAYVAWDQFTGNPEPAVMRCMPRTVTITVSGSVPRSAG